QVHSQIARDLQIVCGPSVAHGVHQAHSASAGNRHQRIRFCSHSVCLHVFQVHANERAHHFQVAQLFSANVHQQVLASRIFTVEALDGILHGCSQLSVGSAKLLQKHVAEGGIR